MKIYFNGFGATKILSGYCIEVEKNSSVSAIKKKLITSIKTQDQYAGLNELLLTTAFASDECVFDDDEMITQDMTLNLLPPVCGG